MKILGISAKYHDAEACLLINGDIIFAAQKELFTCKNTTQTFRLMPLVIV
jgi:carbamoyltransferase